MKSYFFPVITRSTAYAIKADGSYYIYSHYRDQIFLDCSHRCVYCDIALEECGLEGFALDHFRPQEHYPNLKNDPNNLVAACSRCNRLKSSHWPVGLTLAVTHDGNSGFLDPFSCDRHDYIEVSADGEFLVKRPPSLYFISLLELNRPSRRLIRKKRILSRRIDELFEVIEQCITEAKVILENGSDSVLALEKIRIALNVIKELKNIRQVIDSLTAP